MKSLVIEHNIKLADLLSKSLKKLSKKQQKASIKDSPNTNPPDKTSKVQSTKASTMSTVYTQWVARLASGWEGYFPQTIQRVVLETKYDGFSLDDIATKLADATQEELVELLALFHARGSRVDKMMSSIAEAYVEKYQTLINKFGIIKTGERIDKKALTSPRISLALLFPSIQVALKMQRIGIYSDIDNDGAIFGINAIPVLLSYKEISEQDCKEI